MIAKKAFLILCGIILIPQTLLAEEPIGEPAPRAPEPEWFTPEEPAPPVFGGESAVPGFVPWGIVSIGAAAGGAAVTGMGIYNIMNNLSAGFEAAELQSGIVMTIGGGIITSAAAIFLEVILQE